MNPLDMRYYEVSIINSHSLNYRPPLAVLDKENAAESVGRLVNLSMVPMFIGVALSSIFLLLNQNMLQNHHAVVWMYLISIFVELLAEPLIIHARSNSFSSNPASNKRYSSVRSFAEASAIFFRCVVVFICCMSWDGHEASFGMGQLAYSIVTLIIYWHHYDFQFIWIFRNYDSTYFGFAG